VKDAPPNNVLKFNNIKRAEYIRLLREGGRRHVSARAIGIDPGTVVNHRNADPDFAAECDRAESEADDEVEDGLRMAAISGNVTAALAWLYSRQPQRWSDMRKQQISIYDWRKDAEEHGLDAEKLFNDLVNAARARLVEAADGGDDAGRHSGSESAGGGAGESGA